MGLASAVDVGQAVDEALDIHPFFEAGFGHLGLVEFLSGLDLVPVETDEDIVQGRLLAVRSVLRKSVQREFRRVWINDLNPPKGRKVNDQNGEKRSSTWSGGARGRFFVRKVDL